MPVAQFHPADIAPTRLAVLGEVLLRPATAPVFEADLVWRRGCAHEFHQDRMDFTRVFPEQAGTLGQRQSEWGGIESGVRR